MPSTPDLFFQIILFLAGAIVGVIGQILGSDHRKLKILLAILAIFFIVTAFAWTRYEIVTIPSPVLTSTPIEIPAESINRGNVLFTENFENGTASGFRSIYGLWRVVKDETGNWVYEINNKGKQDWSSVLFGTIEWQDYIIEYRTKLVDFGASPYTMMGATFRNSNFDNYHASFAPNDNGFWVQYSNDSNNDYRMLVSTNYHIKVDNWYSVRVEVAGTLIKVFIDNNQEIEATDSTLKSGALGLQVGPNLHVQYDDIVVTEVSK